MYLQVCRRLHTEDWSHIRPSSCRTAVEIRYNQYESWNND